MALTTTLKRVAAAVAAVALCNVAIAQSSVSGTVKDAAGQPVIGASVMIKGTSQGTVTDLDGNFTLPKVNQGQSLVVSSIGLVSQTVKATGQKHINLTLQEDMANLEDVVVIGYGTMKRKNLTGAVASVTGEALAKNPVSNIAEALQGQLPGVAITSQDGRPGATMSVRVRGGGSITQSNEPMYIVDGMPVDNIDDIPADNVESIDVLKDAASTAIYGARGANGVILITTKNAKEGKPVVKLATYYQIQQKPDYLDVQSAYDHVMHDWSYATAYGSTYGENVAKYYGLGSANGNHLEEYRNMAAHNYMDDVLRSGGMWNTDLSVSGGTKKTKYLATVNYTTLKGALIRSGFHRWNVNFKLQQELAKNLQLSLDARYTETQFKGSRYDYATGAYTYKPIDTPLGVDDPTLLGMGSANAEDRYNPLTCVEDVENMRNNYRAHLNTGLTWNALKGLTLKTELGLGRGWSKTKSWYGGHTTDKTINDAKINNTERYHVRWTTTAAYDVQGLGENNALNVMVGNEVLSHKSESTEIHGYGYPAEWNMEQAFGNINMTDKSLGKDTYTSNTGEPEHTTSWFGRVNYSLLDRYLLTATLRADGSSKFATGNKWGYFPAAAVAWRISEEPWMKSANTWLDNLKLRLSIGTSGNDNIDSSCFFTSWSASTTTVNGQSVTTYKPSELLGNPDLKWETTTSRNVGLDYSFLNGKVNGSLDAYWNTTKDCLMRVPCDPSTGFSYQYQNVAQTSNKGLELSVNWNVIRKKDFNLTLGLTYNYNVNNVDELLDGVVADAHTNWGSSMRLPGKDYVVREGQPIGLIVGYRSQGFYRVEDFDVQNGVWTLKPGIPDCTIGNYAGKSAYNTPAGQSAFPGMAKFQDVDGNGTVTDADTDVLAVAPAKHTGSFRANATYKGFDLTANFVFQFGGNVYNANVMHDLMGNKDTSFGSNRLAELSECWRMYDVDQAGDIYPVTDPQALMALNAGAKYALPYSEYGIVNSEFIEDASYLRLQTLTLGYTLPKKTVRAIGITNLRVYFTAGNLFCIKGYSGIDPDINVSPNADSGYSGFPTPNYDFHSYPKTHTFTFGASVTF